MSKSEVLDTRGANDHPGSRPLNGPKARRSRRFRLARTVSVGLILTAVVSVWIWSEHYSADPLPITTPREPSAACGAEIPQRVPTQEYPAAPDMQLRRTVDYWAIIRTSCGDFRADLLEDRAPIAVNNFVFLAKRGFYDGLEWHQIEYDFLIQTGDPNGINGVAPDGPGYSIADEAPSSNRAYTFGTLGFAKSNSDGTAGSQFFVVVHDLRGALKGKPAPLEIEARYAIFGRVGGRFYGSLENIARQPVLGGSDPIESAQPKVPIFVESIRIIERSARGEERR